MSTELPDPGSAGEPPTVTHLSESNASPREAEHAPAGRVGEYDLLDEIGRDGPFALCRAVQPRLHRTVLLKTPTADAVNVKELAALLAKEAEATARFDHPGILRVVESGIVDSRPFLALSFVDGETLAERVDRGPVPDRVAADWARQLAETLFAIHTGGWVHANLRPEYVHVGRDGQVRLSGFGTADRLDELHGYLPPERLPGGRGPDARSDVYGLGGLLYAMLTGRPPFQAERPATLTRRIREVNPRPPCHFRRGVSRDLQAICLKCLSKHPYRRYGDAGAMARVVGDLRKFLSQKPVSARDRGPQERVWLWLHRNRRVFLAAAFVVCGLAASTAWSRHREGQAWNALIDPQATPSERDRAEVYWRRAAETRPNDPETATAAAFARFRSGDYAAAMKLLPITGDRGAARHSAETPNLVVRYASPDTTWVKAQLYIWALAAIEDGQYALARGAIDLANYQSPDSHAAVTGPLDAEIRGRMADGDVLAKAIDAGDLVALADAVNVRATPELVRALIWKTTFYSLADEVDLVRSEARRAISSSDVRAAQQARTSLEKIAPEWPKDEGARRAIPALVVQLAAKQEVTRRTALDLLTRIDLNWQRSPKVAEMLPIWARQVANNPNSPAIQAIKAVAPLDERAPLAADAVEGLRLPLQIVPERRRNGSVSTRNSNDAVQAIEVLELLGPTAAPAVPDLIRRFTIPMYRGEVDAALRREFDAIWRVLPIVDRNWMKHAETNRAMTIWAEWIKQDDSPTARLQARLAAEWTKRVESLRDRDGIKLRK